MRARVRDAAGVPLEGPFYFRGIALDHFDGRRWTHTLGGEVRPGNAPRPVGDVITQSIVLEPLGESVVFGLPGVVQVEGLRGVSVDTSGTWRWRGDASGKRRCGGSGANGRGPMSPGKARSCSLS